MDGSTDFKDILRSHTPMLYRIAASYEADASLQDDLVQEIALALWRALPAFKGNASLKTYVARVAQNRCISHVAVEKRRGIREPLDESIESDLLGPEDQVSELKNQERLAGAIRSLPLPQRQVAVLALEGMKPAEIAEALEISSNNVSVRLNRAKERLKTLVEKQP